MSESKMTMVTGSSQRFREQILGIMDQKHHWAWPYFSGDQLTKAQLKVHFQQEYAVYVRDFPVFLARIHGHNPPPAVRSMLAENIYEEDTGGLSLGRSHPELFMTMMQGLGYPRKAFEDARLLPPSRRYRQWLDQVSADDDWVVGAAVLTVFVEGSINDRQEILTPSKPKSPAEVEEIVEKHPLVRHHGLSPACLDLVRAHQMVEGGHRQDAYAMILTHARGRAHQQKVLNALKQSLDLWLMYRDGVARACRLRTRLTGPNHTQGGR